MTVRSSTSNAKLVKMLGELPETEKGEDTYSGYLTAERAPPISQFWGSRDVWRSGVSTETGSAHVATEAVSSPARLSAEQECSEQYHPFAFGLKQPPYTQISRIEMADNGGRAQQVFKPRENGVTREGEVNSWHSTLSPPSSSATYSTGSIPSPSLSSPKTPLTPDSCSMNSPAMRMNPFPCRRIDKCKWSMLDESVAKFEINKSVIGQRRSWKIRKITVNFQEASSEDAYQGSNCAETEAFLHCFKQSDPGAMEEERMTLTSKSFVAVAESGKEYGGGSWILKVRGETISQQFIAREGGRGVGSQKPGHWLLRFETVERMKVWLKTLRSVIEQLRYAEHVFRSGSPVSKLSTSSLQRSNSAASLSSMTDEADLLGIFPFILARGCSTSAQQGIDGAEYHSDSIEELASSSDSILVRSERLLLCKPAPSPQLHYSMRNNYSSSFFQETENLSTPSTLTTESTTRYSFVPLTFAMRRRAASWVTLARTPSTSFELSVPVDVPSDSESEHESKSTPPTSAQTSPDISSEPSFELSPASSNPSSTAMPSLAYRKKKSKPSLALEAGSLAHHTHVPTSTPTRPDSPIDPDSLQTYSATLIESSSDYSQKSAGSSIDVESCYSTHVSGDNDVADHFTLNP